MNYWTQSPKNIYVAAHRGWCAAYPENTLLAFQKALELGVDQIETDIRITKDGELVLIHDATHPYVDDENMDAVIAATHAHGGATLGERQYDTVYGINPETGILEQVIPRETVVSGASPEAFMFGLIHDIYENTPMEQLERYTSAGALALANDIDMEVVPTNLINLKITYKHDMEVFKKLFHDYYF